MAIFRRRSAIARVKLARALQWRDKQPLGAREIFRLPAPHPTWWHHISEGARRGTQHSDLVFQVTFAGVDDPSVPDFPASLEDWDEELPPVRQDEALALIDKFLLAERGKLVPGVSMFPLHWLALAAYYCPKREPLEALKEFVAANRIQAASQGTAYNGLTWPLTTTDRTVEELRQGRIEARLPTFTKLERWLDSLARAFPRLLGTGRAAARRVGLDA